MTKAAFCLADWVNNSEMHYILQRSVCIVIGMPAIIALNLVVFSVFCGSVLA
jgi:hypothetical protein